MDVVDPDNLPESRKEKRKMLVGLKKIVNTSSRTQNDDTERRTTTAAVTESCRKEDDVKIGHRPAARRQVRRHLSRHPNRQAHQTGRADHDMEADDCGHQPHIGLKENCCCFANSVERGMRT
jgi:hypothetical protein